MQYLCQLTHIPSVFILPVSACSVTSIVSESVTPWTVGHQAPLFLGFSRQEYWSGFPCPPPGDLSHSGIKPASLMSPSLAGGSLPLGLPGNPRITCELVLNRLKSLLIIKSYHLLSIYSVQNMY